MNEQELRLSNAIATAVMEFELYDENQVVRVDILHEIGGIRVNVEVVVKPEPTLSFGNWKKLVSEAAGSFIEAGKWFRTAVLKAESLGFDLAEAGQYADKCAERMERGLDGEN